MKIYTKTGDGGDTGLFGGRRVGKDDPRVSAYGEVDELNAAIGLAIAHLPAGEVAEDLASIQRELFVLGADLATPPDAKGGAAARVVRIGAAHVAGLEAGIDRHDAENEPLTSFVLPGGAPGAAALHLARAVCRRAERAVVALDRVEEVGADARVYLNRLSDLLFVLARRVNGIEGVEETRWRHDDRA